MRTDIARKIRAVSAAALLTIAAVPVPTTADAATGCSVQYAVSNQWSSGFTANVTLTNLGDSLSTWNLVWTFGNGQRVSEGWNAIYAQSGTQVTASNQSWNGTLAGNSSIGIGFNATWNGANNPAPPSFALNGTTCTGAVSNPDPTPPPPSGSLPSSFRWQSSNVLISPRSDATRSVVSIKDPSVVFFNNRWHVYASTASTAGAYSLVYLSFTDWAQAASAPQYHMSNNPNIGGGYRAAPQVFHFAPQNRWYLVYQAGPPVFSTTSDVSRPETWTAPQNFYASEPQIVRDNKGAGGWIDFWVICDTTHCYLFFSDDNGHTYRARTTLANFPNGFDTPVIIMQDSNRFALFEALNIYKLAGQNRYLMLVEAIGSDGQRYFRSWTADRLDGSWTALANTESNPFARSNTVTFSGTPWTRSISHGEMIRSGNNQNMEINPCQLRYLYQGVDPGSTAPYNLLPWRLGLLTQTNSTC